MQQPAKSEGPDPWKPLVVCPNASVASLIRASLGEQGILDACIVSEYPPAGTIVNLASRQGSNVCFLDVASNAERALPLIPEMAPALPLVALNPGNDADLILRCLRLGASEFLSDPAADQMADVLDRLSKLRARVETRKSGAVYCVIPGKPGCGASTLAAHLAIDLKRTGTSKVLLVDVDSVSGSIAFLLKLKSDYHLGDAVRDWQRMDSDLWGRLVVPCHGVDVLLAPENPSIRVAVDQQAAFELVHFWRTHYEAIVLDLPGSYAPGFEFAPIADELLLVTNNELAAVHTTRRTLECLEKISVDRSRIKLVVSRYLTSAGLKREDVQTALRLEPYAVLGSDYDALQSALLDGKPVAADSHLGRAIRGITERLSGKQRAAKKRPTLLGLLAHKS